jgi:DNA-binding transcriptional ArsR family regulator
VSQLAEGSGVDMSVVSRHLATLREAGIITCVKRGKEVLCTVETSVVAGILRDLADALEACCPAGICRTDPAASPVTVPSRSDQSPPPARS